MAGRSTAGTRPLEIDGRQIDGREVDGRGPESAGTSTGGRSTGGTPATGSVIGGTSMGGRSMGGAWIAGRSTAGRSTGGDRPAARRGPARQSAARQSWEGRPVAAPSPRPRRPRPCSLPARRRCARGLTGACTFGAAGALVAFWARMRRPCPSPRTVASLARRPGCRVVLMPRRAPSVRHPSASGSRPLSPVLAGWPLRPAPRPRLGRRVTGRRSGLDRRHGVRLRRRSW